MNNMNYDFSNTGYKLHLPVLVDEKNHLTQNILQYLDNTFGTTSNDRFGYKKGIDGGFYSKCYKLGNCSDATTDGKGITIYGKTGTREEMEQIAKNIENTFGPELSLNVKNNGIIHTPVDSMVTKNVSGRFANYSFGTKTPNGVVELFFNYNHSKNPSGSNTIKIYTDHNGVKKMLNLSDLSKMSDLEKAFLNGDSTLASIDNFGELFVGKLENGKLPDSIMKSFAPEYLAKYPNLINELPNRLQKGTEKIVANMLEDIAVKGDKSSLLRQGAAPWLTTLEHATIDGAKKALALNNPQAVQNLEDLLPQFVKKQNSLSVLEKTTPLAKISGVNTGKVVVGKIHQQNVVNSSPKPNVAYSASFNVKVVKDGMSKSKIGLIATGIALAAGGAYLAFKKNKKETVTQELQQPKQALQPSTKPLSQNPMFSSKTFQGNLKQHTYPQKNPYQSGLII